MMFLSAVCARMVRVEWVSPVIALTDVLERHASFRRGGALRQEGGERALRGFLMTGFFMRSLQWPWDRLVLGESLDLLAVDWRDQPVIYVETKTPMQALHVRHRAEVAGRLDRWGSFRHAVLTNGALWERFDDFTTRPLKPTVEFDVTNPRTADDFFAPLNARRYLSNVP